MGYKIKEMRESKGMTTVALAKKSGVSRVTIWSLENDPDYTTTTKTLMKIANALETTIDNLFYADCLTE